MKRLVLAAIAVTLCARAAGATVGGPELARVLGWDPKLERVYVQIVHTDESENTPTLWYFDLGSDRPAQPRYVDWSGGEGDVLYDQRLAGLQKTLHPLRAEEAVESTLGFAFDVPARWDSVLSDDGHRPRYLARAASGRNADEHFRVLTLNPGRQAVRKLREYALPGRSARLLILSCEAVPMEEGYEIQFPVLTRAGPGTADPIDPRAFDVRR